MDIRYSYTNLVQNILYFASDSINSRKEIKINNENSVSLSSPIITLGLLVDLVLTEHGKTYERKATKEWFKNYEYESCLLF